MRWILKKGVPVITDCAHRSFLNDRGFPAFPNIDTQATHVLGLNAEGIDWDRIAEKVTFSPDPAMGY